MAIYELFDTQEEHDTAEGWSVQRKFLCTWADWYNQGGTYYDENGTPQPGWSFPIIGDEWVGRPQLAVTSRDVEAVDNTNCKVTITYSTQSDVAREVRADQVSSWEERLEIEYESNPVLVWYDWEEETYKDWAHEWRTNGPTVSGADPTDDNRPQLMLYAPRQTYYLTTYGSKLWAARVIGALNTVNNSQFVYRIGEEKSKVDPRYEDDTSTLTDQGKWRFTGCTITRAARNTYRYDMRFEYNPDGWNVAYGITTNMYRKSDLYQLVKDMAKATDDNYGGVRS